ncbi:MAG: quinone oxidoreductase [Herminiimonas sp.]|nr:quinone oxidoreductase [Herminiimonas sp.]
MKQNRVRIYEQGSPSVLRYEQAAIGAPGPGQVRLRHDAIGLNFVDSMFRDGSFGVSLPFDLGVEGAGVIEAVGGGVENLGVGDRVAYYFTPGAYADVRLIDAEFLMKLPDDVSTDLAAALTTKGLTAWMLLKRVHPIRQGEFVLVQGASGGVGSLVSRWAKALGATVIAAVSSPAKAADVRSHGIEHVLASNDPDFTATVLAITDGRGVDVVFEFVGKATIKQSVQALRTGGHLVHVGSASGLPVSKDTSSLAARRIRYTQPSTPQYVNSRSNLNAASSELFAAFRAGVFGEIDPARYRLSDVVRSHEDMAARRITGPAILIP